MNNMTAEEKNHEVLMFEINSTKQERKLKRIFDVTVLCSIFAVK